MQQRRMTAEMESTFDLTQTINTRVCRVQLLCQGIFPPPSLTPIATEAPSSYLCANLKKRRWILQKPSSTHWSPIVFRTTPRSPVFFSRDTRATAPIRNSLHSARVGEVERRSHCSSRVAKVLVKQLHHRSFARSSNSLAPAPQDF